MKKILAAILLFITPSVCPAGEWLGPGKFYVEVGVGKSCFCSQHGNDMEWKEGGGIGARAALGYRHSITLFDAAEGHLYGHLSLEHYSQWDTGRPFNDRYETTSEHAFYSVGWEF